jgi:hypothetical protein
MAIDDMYHNLERSIVSRGSISWGIDLSISGYNKTNER